MKHNQNFLKNKMEVPNIQPKRNDTMATTDATHQDHQSDWQTKKLKGFHNNSLRYQFITIIITNVYNFHWL